MNKALILFTMAMFTTGIVTAAEVKKDVKTMSPNDSVRIVLPDKYIAIVGTPIQLFYRGLVESANPYQYNIVVDCSKGNDTRRYWQYTPILADVGSHPLMIRVYSDGNKLLASATTEVEVVCKAQNPATVKNILTIGDSLNAGGFGWGSKLAAQVVRGIDRLPGLSAFSNFEFIGEQGLAPEQYTACGGSWWIGYNIAPDQATADIWVYCTHNKDASDQESIWVDTASHQWQLETIESNRLMFKRHGHTANMPGAPTSLTHALNANHTAPVSYTSTQAAGKSPFWNSKTSKVDFINWFATKYPAKTGQGIDACFVLFGWNSQRANYANITDHKNYLKEAKIFIDNLHADYPDCKVFVMGIQVPSTDGGLGYNYGAKENSLSNYWGMLRTVMGLNLAYQSLCNEAAYSKFCTFINISGQFDSENNMRQIATAVNLRSTKTELRGNNGVHPSRKEGYLQISDAAIRCLVKCFCQ